MRIAIVGSGIAGLTAAHRLAPEHEVTLFEAGRTPGGHTSTVEIDDVHGPCAVDMGFIVFNDWTYPRFVRLLGELGVLSEPTSMSFSVSCERSGLEYNGTSIELLFAQRRNLVNGPFLRMLADIMRFNWQVRRARPGDDVSLGDYLRRHRYSRGLLDYYLLPMARSIWSATERSILAFPAGFFVSFFERHGFLSVDRRPVWRVVRGGSQRYVDALLAAMGTRVRLQAATAVAGIRRSDEAALVRTRCGRVERFDQVVLACHADEALALLEEPSPLESEILGAFPFQGNDVVLHTDERLLPRTLRARAAWNYHRLADDPELVAVTYDMTRLQGLHTRRRYLVTLNRSGQIDPAQVIRAARFSHPVFSPRTIAAQRRWAQISGHRRTHFCGAYWRNGFHEDGCVSGERVALELLRPGHPAAPPAFAADELAAVGPLTEAAGA